MPTGAPFYKFLPDGGTADDDSKCAKSPFRNNKKILFRYREKSEGKVVYIDTMCRIKTAVS